MLMASDFVRGCLSRAISSIQEVRNSGRVPNAIEISCDVWSAIQFGGIRMAGAPVFAGLRVIEREDLFDHIQAVVVSAS